MSWFRTIATSKGKRTALYAVFFFIGVVCATVNRIDISTLVLVVVALLPWALFLRAQKNVSCVMFAIIFFVFGMMRFGYALPMSSQTFVQRNQIIDAKVGLDVQYQNDTQRLVVPYNDTHIVLWLPRYPHVATGDILRVACMPTIPQPFEGFNYDTWLLAKGIQYECDRVSSFVVMKQGDDSLLRSFALLREKFRLSIARVIPEPHASILAGILYGERSSIPQHTKDAFRATGTSHILAISGYNITVLVVVLTSVLGLIGINRKRMIWISIALVCVFVVFVSESSSVIRAAIMGLTPLCARNFGRITFPLYVLIHSAFIMVLINPLILPYDPGFQLSFIATAGIILLQKPIESLCMRRFHFTSFLSEAISVCSAAYIATLPISLYHFGFFSFVAIPANVLIAFVIPLIMATGALAIIAGLINIKLLVVLAAVPYLLLSYMLFVIDSLSSISFATGEIHISLATVFIMYLLMIYGGMYKPHIPSLASPLKIEGVEWRIQEDI